MKGRGTERQRVILVGPLCSVSLPVTSGNGCKHGHFADFSKTNFFQAVESLSALKYLKQFKRAQTRCVPSIRGCFSLFSRLYPLFLTFFQPTQFTLTSVNKVCAVIDDFISEDNFLYGSAIRTTKTNRGYLVAINIKNDRFAGVRMRPMTKNGSNSNEECYLCPECPDATAVCYCRLGLYVLYCMSSTVCRLTQGRCLAKD